MCADHEYTHSMKKTNFMFVWPCILNMKWFVRPTWCNNYDLLINHQLNKVRAPLGPSSEAQGHIYLHVVLGSWEAGCMHSAEAVIWIEFESIHSLYTVHMTCLPASQDSYQHVKCWKPHAVIYGLALLKMGTMMPKTCWAKCWLINHSCCIKLISQIISYEKGL